MLTYFLNADSELCEIADDRRLRIVSVYRSWLGGLVVRCESLV